MFLVPQRLPRFIVHEPMAPFDNPISTLVVQNCSSWGPANLKGWLHWPPVHNGAGMAWTSPQLFPRMRTRFFPAHQTTRVTQFTCAGSWMWATRGSTMPSALIKRSCCQPSSEHSFQAPPVLQRFRSCTALTYTSRYLAASGQHHMRRVLVWWQLATRLGIALFLILFLSCKFHGKLLDQQILFLQKWHNKKHEEQAVQCHSQVSAYSTKHSQMAPLTSARHDIIQLKLCLDIPTCSSRPCWPWPATASCWNFRSSKKPLKYSWTGDCWIRTGRLRRGLKRSL